MWSVGLTLTGIRRRAWHGPEWVLEEWLSRLLAPGRLSFWRPWPASSWLCRYTATAWLRRCGWEIGCWYYAAGRVAGFGAARSFCSSRRTVYLQNAAVKRV